MAEEVLVSLDPPEPEAIHLGGKGMQLNAHAPQSPITRQKTHPIRDGLDDTGSMASGRREQKRIWNVLYRYRRGRHKGSSRKRSRGSLRFARPCPAPAQRSPGKHQGQEQKERQQAGQLRPQPENRSRVP